MRVISVKSEGGRDALMDNPDYRLLNALRSQVCRKQTTLGFSCLRGLELLQCGNQAEWLRSKTHDRIGAQRFGATWEGLEIEVGVPNNDRLGPRALGMD
jgi:hypothetical protein